MQNSERNEMLENQKDSIIEKMRWYQEEYNKSIVHLISLIEKQTDIPPEFNNIVNDNFWELI